MHYIISEAQPSHCMDSEQVATAVVKVLLQLHASVQQLSPPLIDDIWCRQPECSVESPSSHEMMTIVDHHSLLHISDCN